MKKRFILRLIKLLLVLSFFYFLNPINNSYGTNIVSNSNNNLTNTNTISNTTQLQSSVASSNANLVDLGVVTYDFKGFTPANTSYNTLVPNNVKSVSVYAKVQDPGAIYSVSGHYNLDVGKNKITVTVTAADKKTTKEYYIYVDRKESDSKDEQDKEESELKDEQNKKEDKDDDKDKVNTDTKLRLISIAIDNDYDIYLEPEYKPEVHEYIINLKEDIDSIPFKIIANQQDAKEEIEGNKDLKDGENNILIKVTSKDGKEKIEYKIIVRKNMHEVEDYAQIEAIEPETNNQNTEHIQYGWYIIGGILLLFMIILIAIVIASKRTKNNGKHC